MNSVDPYAQVDKAMRVNLRMVFDGVFITFIIGAIFYAGQQTNQVSTLTESVKAIAGLNVDSRLTALDVQSKDVAKQLEAIAAKQDAMIEQLSKLTAEVQDDRRRQQK